MKVLRTPDERFADLEGDAFEPHYADVSDADGTVLRIHHLDEGPRDAAPILLMHGNPTWAYLYRKFVPPLVTAAAGLLADAKNLASRMARKQRRIFATPKRTLDANIAASFGIER